MLVLKSSYKHLSLYLHGDSLFVYSLATFNLYAFKEESAALFLMLEDNIEEAEEISKENESIKLIKQILSASDESFEEVTTLENSDAHLEVCTEQKNYIFYRLNNFVFYFDMQDRKVLKKIDTLFKHIKSTPLIGESINRVAIEVDNGVYKVYINNKFTKEIDDIYQIVPIVLGLIRFMYYRQEPFLVALHAASLEYKGRVLIIPGVSGAGKSTLSVYLSTRGFKLYSDELSVITTDEMMLPIPLGVGVKESSWNLVSEFVPNIEELEVHRRYDAQRVKYAQLDSYASSKLSVKSGVIIFSKYKKNVKSKLEPIDIVETLNIIMNSQYHIYDPKDVTVVAQWLKLLATFEMYRFEYSDLNEAEEIIKKVMEHE